jgi:hypothetical protein
MDIAPIVRSGTPPGARPELLTASKPATIETNARPTAT